MNLERFKTILERHEQVDAAYLYGSAARGNLRPYSDVDLALLLAEHGVFSQVDAESFKQMVRFRNLLVHAYAKLDYQQVHNLIETGPLDIEKYIDAVVAYCKL